MGQYTSYYLYQKYESRNGQDPVPCSPSVYSIDADGTMEKVIKLENDPDCGYTPPPVEPIYRWYQIPITEDYICANCPSGTTIERWVNSGTTCFEGDLYNLQVKQISYDGGSTWENTSDTQIGELIEVGSPMCNKAVLTLSDSSNVYVECNNSTTLYYSELSAYTGVRNAAIGECVTTIGQEAFYGKPLTAITLPSSVTTIGNAAFMTCTKLSTISLDDVISIGDNAFQTCTGLTSVEIGSGVTYIGWAAFEGCTSLTSITINATTPPTLHLPSAYPNTFNNTNNCPIYVPYGSIGAYKAAWTNYASRIYGIGYLERWVNLDPSVDYYCEGNIKYYKQKKQWSIDGSTWFDVDPPEYQMGSEIGSSSDCENVAPYFSVKPLADGNISFKTTNNQQYSYSIDSGNTWTSGNSATTITMTANQPILFRSELSPTGNGIGKFSATSNYNVEGNVMSLLYGIDFENKIDLSGKNYVFRDLFRNDTHLVSAENLVLPATTLASHCYYSMFASCTSLTTAPVLSATTLASSCYDNMFYGCTSLTTAPSLPATILASYCYNGMFYNCTSLTTASSLLATTLTSSCYNSMFYGCVSLTTAPVLSATTLASSCCGWMFYGCTSLTTAPELLATTLADSCYAYMFYDCSNLNSIKCLAQTFASNSVLQWVRNVSVSGTFYKASNVSWNSGMSGIPNGWSVVEV